MSWLGRIPGTDTAPGTSLLLTATSTDRGATFSAPAVVARNVCPCCRPALAASSNDTWFVVWRNVDAEVRDRVASTTRDGARSWSPPVPVSKDGWKIPGCPHSGAALALANGELHVAWYSEGEGTGRVYWAKSATPTLAFSARRELSTGVTDANHPSLTVAGHEVLAAFEGREASERQGWGALGVFVRRLGSPDERAARVPAGPGSAAYPEILSLGGGRWMVAWTSTEGTGSSVLAARARTGQ